MNPLFWLLKAVSHSCPSLIQILLSNCKGVELIKAPFFTREESG